MRVDNTKSPSQQVQSVMSDSKKRRNEGKKREGGGGEECLGSTCFPVGAAAGPNDL